MDALNRAITEKEIYRDLKRYFDHPGTLLYRGRELSEVNRFLINKHFDKSSILLDLGCAEGRIGEILFNNIAVGLDIEMNQAQVASKIKNYRSVVLADARNMPFKNDSFDIIFSNSVIEHIDGLKELLRESSRILKDKGLFIFTVPLNRISLYLSLYKIFSGIGFSSLAKHYAYLRNRMLRHYNLFDSDTWNRILFKDNFSVIYEKTYLSKKETFLWDKICILLRITKLIPFIHSHFKKRYFALVSRLLEDASDTDEGANILIVAEKRQT
jgi:SAM-dependent methyltransferase